MLGERPGQPEFVTLSMDGEALLGATTEEYEVWLIAVDHIRERQEAAAKAVAQESPQEQAAAWAPLFKGPRPSKTLREMWAHGLARNPATPDDLRAGLPYGGFYGWPSVPPCCRRFDAGDKVSTQQPGQVPGTMKIHP
ncbi:hypothetical protein VR41_06605 [Streptomyces sp. NRRL B-1568]|nr:hypothetical protein VR41_06605 [Streptomyces sp. NRRL B-1568]